MKQTYVHWFSCRYLASWADQWSLLDGGLQDAAQLTIPLYDADTLAALHAGCHCHCVVATHAAVLFLSKVNWFFLILEGRGYSLHAHRKNGTVPIIWYALVLALTIILILLLLLLLLLFLCIHHHLSHSHDWYHLCHNTLPSFGQKKINQNRTKIDIAKDTEPLDEQFIYLFIIYYYGISMVATLKNTNLNRPGKFKLSNFSTNSSRINPSFGRNCTI